MYYILTDLKTKKKKNNLALKTPEGKSFKNIELES